MKTQRLTKLQLVLMTYCSSATPKLRAYQFSAACGIPNTRLSEYQHGRRPIPYHHLMILCDVLRCRPLDIIGWTSTDDVLDLDPTAEYQDLLQ